ncbi:MAG: RpiB/LacA/LacB family sugar-phosphate isomerase [Clostridia bacterium]|nr:RpiB/LacA/LacB family sugar-phosphate isomerase [Clostridia bacterium]
MIIIGADHAGFELKEKIKKSLQKENFDIVDVGAFKVDDVDDFSHFVKLLVKVFDENKECKIISVCGSGVGMNVGLNKHKGIRAVVGHTVEEIVLAREHNNVNALSLSGRTTSLILAKKMINAFLNTKNLSGKYEKRMKDIEII